MFNEILPLAEQILRKHFNVIDIIDLNHYGQRPLELFDKLSKKKKAEYENNDRIVFLLEDHDYYLNGTGPGFQLYNLQLILTHLDIPNYFCLLITGQPDYEEYTRLAQSAASTDNVHIRSITSLLNTSWLQPTNPRQPNIESIEKLFCVLSRQGRIHRTFFMSKIFDASLEEVGIIGYNNVTFYDDGLSKEHGNEFADPRLGFLIQPKYYPPLLIRNPENRRIMSQFQSRIHYFKNFSESTDISSRGASASLNANNPIQNSLIYVGLETQFDLKKVFISRISLRGIIERRPFLLFAVPGSLKRLHDEGFKTFDSIWNESYDRETDFEVRVDQIIAILRSWQHFTINDLRDAYNEMAAIVDYNHEHYFNCFLEEQRSKFETNCIQNLKGNP